MARASDPALARQAALAVVRALRTAGHVAYLAGGCVRDELLGLRPTDYDVATDATPQRIAALFQRTAEVGAAFGVVLVKPGPELGLSIPRGASVAIEVATFRADGPYTDRRRPDSITFSDERADASRRDFTINALFLDPIQGRVIDHVGGQADIANRVLRAVGDPAARLAEDHLRALRAVRFAARFGLTIHPETARAISEHARELRGVSRERIGEELRRIAAHPAFAHALDLLEQLGLDGPVLDEPTLQAPHPRLKNLPPIARPWTTVLAAWLLDRADARPPLPAAQPLRRRLRTALTLSNDELDALTAALDLLQALRTEWPSASVARQKRLAATAEDPQGPFRQALDLLRAEDPAAAEAVTQRVDHLARTPGGLHPQPLLTGDDLVAKGWKPGPSFKSVLDAVYDAQLEGRINTRQQALELAQTHRV